MTICAQLCMSYLFIVGFLRMYTNHNPYISSIETSVNHKQSHKFGELNPTHFALLDHNDKYYTLQEAKRYAELKIVHIRYTYDISDDKIKQHTNTTTDHLIDCSEKDFQKTEAEKQYYKVSV